MGWNANSPTATAPIPTIPNRVDFLVEANAGYEYRLGWRIMASESWCESSWRGRQLESA